jgi:GH15 family glucan-1,4-alpha-glucosidase
MTATPIADYALLSDRRTAALVSRDGSVDWLCAPRFDSPAVLGRLLDPGAGHWSVSPVDPDAEATRRHVDDTMLLETTWTTATGTATVTDALATGGADDPHAIGAAAPRLLVRALECTGGEVEMAVEFAPRPEYGLVEPLVTAVAGGVVARGGADVVVLSCPTALDVADATASGRLRLAAGDRMLLGLQHRTTAEPWPGPLPAEDLDDALRATADAWRAWSRLHQNYRGPWRDLVHHSGRVLQALSYQPTGAVVAAATTSLPEQVGGERNWDYRYAWVRDASFTLEALWIAACPDEAHQFFDYLAASSAGQVLGGRDLQIMFGVGGEHDLSERTLPHLSGWRGSRPVRVGNGAWSQRQIDVYGELLGSAHRLVAQLNPDHPGATAWREFLGACADAAARRWREKDQGIWEVRGEPRHFLYSKLMCWVALDRAVALAGTLRATDRIPAWRAAADEIRAAILSEGWDDTAKSFTQSFGSPDLDASTVMIGLVGFLPPDDPRVVATVEAVADRLTDARGLVYRYRTASGSNTDGLAGEEGTFLLCTFWLAQALAAAGQVARARTVFERAVRYVNDVGLLAEEVDPATGDLLGNFPQAFSHIGLINAAWAIAQAEEATPRARANF